MSSRDPGRYAPVEDDEYVEEDAGIPEEKLDEIANRRSQNGHSSFGTVSLADFASERRKTNLNWTMNDGRTITLSCTYDPNMVNDAALGDIRELTDAGDSLAAAEVFCRTVIEWGIRGPLTALVIARDENGDVRRDKQDRPVMVTEVLVPDGELVPLRPEIVQYVRSDIVLGVWGAINQEVSNQGKKESSSRRNLRRR